MVTSKSLCRMTVHDSGSGWVWNTSLSLLELLLELMGLYVHRNHLVLLGTGNQGGREFYI